MKRNKNLRASIEMLVIAVIIVLCLITLMFISILLNREKKDVEVFADHNLTIIIDPGHGGEDGGTIGINGILEKELNLDISKKLCSLFEAAGINCVMTRTEDKLLYDPLSDYEGRKKVLDMRERLRITKEYEDALFVSIHMNSFPEKKYNGLQVYYSKNNPMSKTLADSIQSTIRTYLQPTNNRETKVGKDIYLLDRLYVPTVLIECGFLSNEAECERLSDEKYRDELSFWIFYSILCEINKKTLEIA